MRDELTRQDKKFIKQYKASYNEKQAEVKRLENVLAFTNDPEVKAELLEIIKKEKSHLRTAKEKLRNVKRAVKKRK